MKYVYVVLEFEVYRKKQEPVIHGVFAKREYAEDKAKKMESRHQRKGYIAVLKKRVLG